MNKKQLDDFNELESTMFYLRVNIESVLPDNDDRKWAIEKCDDLIRVVKYAMKSHIFDEVMKEEK